MAAKAKFEVYESKGQFRFRLKAKNGEIISSSQGYKTKSGCIRGIESLRKNVVDAVIDETEKK